MIISEDLEALWDNVREINISGKSNYIDFSVNLFGKLYFFTYQYNVFLDTQSRHLLKIHINDEDSTNWIILRPCLFAFNEAYREIYDVALFVVCDNINDIGNREAISNTLHLFATDWKTYDALLEKIFAL